MDFPAVGSRTRGTTGPILLTILFVILCAVTWRKWANLLVDFGREVYVPWQLSTGEVLYQDVASLFGPFSPYWNALLFRLFGTSLTVLILGNLTLVALITAILYDFFRLVCSSHTATINCSVFLLVFAFANYTIIGNYNFVCPYSHEITHGLLFCVVIPWSFVRFLRRRQIGWCVLGGLALGLAFLTKPEIFIAALASAATGVFLLWIGPDSDLRRRVRAAGGALVAGALVPLLAGVIYFGMHVSLGESIFSTGAAWVPSRALTSFASPFYLTSTGLDAPLGNASRMFLAFFTLSSVIAVGGLLDRWLGYKVSRPRGVGFLGGWIVILTLLYLIALTNADPWGWARALPLTTSLIGVWCLIRYLRTKPSSSDLPRNFALSQWSAFSLTLLLKILLFSRIRHYGVFLAFPATLLLSTAVIDILTTHLRELGQQGKVYVGYVAPLVGAMIALPLLTNIQLCEVKNTPVGTGGDVLYIGHPAHGEYSRAVSAAWKRLSRILGPEDTLLVLPEGAIFNYLTRSRNPSPYTQFLPPEVSVYREARMLDTVRSGSPDYVVVIYKDTREYGVPPFGSHEVYGKRILDWVRDHYQEVEIILANPLEKNPSQFGIAILKKKVD